MQKYSFAVENPKGKSNNFITGTVSAKSKTWANMKICEQYGCDPSEIISVKEVQRDKHLSKADGFGKHTNDTDWSY